MYYRIPSVMINFILGILLAFFITAIDMTIELTTAAGGFLNLAPDMQVNLVRILVFMGLALFWPLIAYNKKRYEAISGKSLLYNYDKKTFWKTLLIPLLIPTALLLLAVLWDWIKYN